LDASHEGAFRTAKQAQKKSDTVKKLRTVYPQKRVRRKLKNSISHRRNQKTSKGEEEMHAGSCCYDSAKGGDRGGLTKKQKEILEKDSRKEDITKTTERKDSVTWPIKPKKTWRVLPPSPSPSWENIFRKEKEESDACRKE